MFLSGGCCLFERINNPPEKGNKWCLTPKAMIKCIDLMTLTEFSDIFVEVNEKL